MTRHRKITRINLDGTAWLEAEEGVELPVQLVMNRQGAIGAVVVDAHDALGIDQGPAAVPPPPAAAPAAATRRPRNEFDISGLDQS